MSEPVKEFSLTIEKFTKQNVFDMLKGIAEGLSAIQFLDDNSKNLFLATIKRNFEPQSGGGKSNNPSHVDPTTGLMVHWCRFLKKYMPEVDMVMSQGKSKGASKLASKHNYELGKKATALKDEALALFANQQFQEGAAKNAEAVEVEESRNKVETYTPEVLAQYLPKAKEPEAPATIAEAVAAPVAAQVATAPAGTLLGHDEAGQPVYQQ